MKPWAKTKARKRVLSPDEKWANELERKLLAACHPPQRAAATDPSRRISLLVGRGGGKTTTKRVRALIKMARKPRARIVYFATTRTQAEELNWIPLKDLLDRIGEADEFELSESKMRCTCKRTGATYKMVGADDKGEIEKYRGQPFDEVQVDEGASHGELLEFLIDRIVGPRLGERQGCIVVGGTPGHILSGRFYDITRPGATLHRPWGDRELEQYAEWKGWSSHAWTLKEVAELPNARRIYPALVALWEEALLEKQAQQWSDDNPIWCREYLGRWAADDTTTVFRYRVARNRWRPFGDHALAGLELLRAALAKLPKDLGAWHHVLSMDMGHADPFACNVYSFAPADKLRRIWHTFAFERTGMYAKTIAELLIGEELNAEKPAGIFGLTGWPSGAVFDADLAVIEELANVYGVRAKKADRKAEYKFGAIELVNGDLIDERIYAIEGTPLETQLLELQWKVDDYGRPKENKAQANHSSDTLVYGRLLISEMFESGTVAAEQPPRTTVGDPHALASSEPDPEPRGRPSSYESYRAPGAYEDPFA